MKSIKTIVIICCYLNIAYASNLCTANGGQIVHKVTPKGKKYKVCVFEDNRQCEMRALKSGACRMGGVKITGYDNDAQVYCAIKGGQILAKPNARCKLPNGKYLSQSQYY